MIDKLNNLTVSYEHFKIKYTKEIFKRKYQQNSTNIYSLQNNRIKNESQAIKRNEIDSPE